MVGSANFFFNGLAHADPELVCDENDEPIGIRLNLPEPIVKKIKEYIGEEVVDLNFVDEQQFIQEGKKIKTGKQLAQYILYANKQNYYINETVLEKNFYQKMEGLFYNGTICCGSCKGLSDYWWLLHRLLSVYF